jgi:hypothetical protein
MRARPARRSSNGLESGQYDVGIRRTARGGIVCGGYPRGAIAFYLDNQPTVDTSQAGQQQKWKEFEDIADAPPRGLSRGVEPAFGSTTISTGTSFVGWFAWSRISISKQNP